MFRGKWTQHTVIGFKPAMQLGQPVPMLTPGRLTSAAVVPDPMEVPESPPERWFHGVPASHDPLQMMYGDLSARLVVPVDQIVDQSVLATECETVLGLPVGGVSVLQLRCYTRLACHAPLFFTKHLSRYTLPLPDTQSKANHSDNWCCRELLPVVNMRLRLRLMDGAVSVTDSVAKFKALQQDEGSALYTSTTQLKWLDSKYAPVIELPPAGVHDRFTNNLNRLYSTGEKELEDFMPSQQSAQERTASEVLIAQLYQAEKTGLLKLGKHGQGRPDTLNLGQLTNVLPVSHTTQHATASTQYVDSQHTVR